jgi:hypothetical protein
MKLYYSGKDGFTITNLLMKAEDYKPTILLIKTNTLHVFGAFITQEWHKDVKKPWGDRECFLFSLHPLEAKYTYNSNAPPHFVMVTNNSISIGKK